MYPNRTLCGVLEEMRACYKTRNFASLLGLIEEAQAMGNRMEASLFDKHDYEKIRDKLKEAKNELKTIEDELSKARSVSGSRNQDK